MQVVLRTGSTILTNGHMKSSTDINQFSWHSPIMISFKLMISYIAIVPASPDTHTGWNIAGDLRKNPYETVL